MRKLDLVHCERPMLVLEIDVEIDRIHRNLVCTEAICYLPYSCLGIVTKTRLLEPKRPQRRKRGRPSKPSVCGQHLFRIRSIKDVIVERAAVRTKGVKVGRLFAEV